MSKIFQTIQDEMKVWQAHNFPGRESWMPLMGLGEELGELANSDNDKDTIDAVGDCCIYLADYCNAMGFDLASIAEGRKQPNFSIRITFSNYGKLCHAHLKTVQKIRLHESHRENSIRAISDILSYLSLQCVDPIEEVTWKVWLKVRERDWQKNRDTAHLEGEQK